MKATIHGFINSTGILLLAMATALFVANLATHTHCVVPLRDPLLNLQLPVLFWILGGIGFVAGGVCLFRKNDSAQLMIILWLGTNALFFRLGLVWTNTTGGFTGYLGDVADAFGLSCAATNNFLCAGIAYLLIGSLVGLVLLRRQPLQMALNSDMDQMKLACPHCGTRIQFTTDRLGRTIPCPHCQTVITLRKPDLLKMTCFFCKGHIEFPAHAIGERIACPHCKMDISLKEQT
jgi:DNA-directed RNA polymerase subunit RPC12/RpoP